MILPLQYSLVKETKTWAFQKYKTEKFIQNVMVENVSTVDHDYFYILRRLVSTLRKSFQMGFFTLLGVRNLWCLQLFLCINIALV